MIGFPDGNGYGSHIASGTDAVNLMLDNLIGDVVFVNEEAALPPPDGPLVIIVAHGSILGPLPVMAAFGRMYLRHGLGNEMIGFYAHRAVEMTPGMCRFFEMFGMLTKVPTVIELVRLLKNGDIRVAGNSFEGTSCLFSWDEEIGPFRNGGMLDAAIKAEAAICLIVHKGTEPWSVKLNLPGGKTVPFIKGLRGINLFLGPIKKLDRLTILCSRYKPGIKRLEYEELEASQRRAVLKAELEKLRQRLIEMTAEIIDRQDA
ncbi:MAG: hypothetical protein WC889_05450 [Myxococcota bacterium]|jgi:hypothetical protein